MSLINFQGYLKETAGRFKRRFGRLVHSNRIYLNGREEEFLGRLQKKFVKPKQA